MNRPMFLWQTAMAVPIVALLCVAFADSPTHARPTGPRLSVEIAAPSIKETRTLPIGARFPLVVTNVSPDPLQVWSKGCSWGYRQLAFELTDGDGQSFVIEVKERQWRRNHPIAWKLAPGESLVLDVVLGADLWSSPISFETMKGKSYSVRPVFRASRMTSGGGVARLRGGGGRPTDVMSEFKDVWTGMVSGAVARTYRFK